MSDINDDNEGNDDLRQENEFIKMKMMLERGAYFGTPEGPNALDPFIENEFLKNIERFEAAYENSKKIKLYDYLGRPEFPVPDTIPSDRIEEELDKLLSFLNERDISLTTLCPVEPAVLYRFIVEEFFETEKDDVHIEGMMSCYTYEDFHPNDEYSLGESTLDFLLDLLDTEEDYYSHHIADEFTDRKKLQDFRESFTSFSRPEVEISQVEIAGDQAKVKANVTFTGVCDGSTSEQLFSGECLLNFVHHGEYWYVSDIKLPPAEL
jgi:hypothetical protein